MMVVRASALFLAAFAVHGQSPGEWPMFNRDLAGTRFSPLTQINVRNVGQLSKVWSHALEQEPYSGGITGGSEFTPIVVKGVLYLATSKSVLALETESGNPIWRYDSRTAPSRRAVAYWAGDRNNPPRIIFTSGRRMIALNATTGKIDPGFGKEGEVDLVVPYESAPVVYKNLLFVGANVQESPALGPPGNTRAYDARTGAKVWEFHAVPLPREAGHD